MRRDILILGGGASGLAAALSAAKEAPGARITLLEGLDRPGKKILATGNGRCNLTNREMDPVHYHSSQPELLPCFLRQMPTERVLRFFSELGLCCATEEMGRVYPYARQASAVLDTLLLALEHTGVEVLCAAKVRQAEWQGHGFQVVTQDGRHFCSRALILAAGGRAAPKQGTDGTGFALAKQLGHRYATPFPCLVALKCSDEAVKGLKGVRAQGKVTLLRNGAALGTDQGEIQFTDYGLSGIPVFQLSCLPGRNFSGVELSVDLLPKWSRQELVHWLLTQSRRYPQEPLERFLPGLIHPKLLRAVMNAVGLSPLSRPADSLSTGSSIKLAEGLKDWHFHVTGPLSWDHAQVTGGGVLLEEIGPDFASRQCPGLFLCGEVLDVVGDCGGYNLHWAWCSGLSAGKAAAGMVGWRNGKELVL